MTDKMPMRIWALAKYADKPHVGSFSPRHKAHPLSEEYLHKEQLIEMLEGQKAGYPIGADDEDRMRTDTRNTLLDTIIQKIRGDDETR